MRRKRIKQISIETVPNGYTLKFDGMKVKDGYMYFSTEELLKGFLCHIGLKQTDMLTKEQIDNFMKATIDWESNVKCVKDLENVTNRLLAANRSRADLASRVVYGRENLLKLVKSIDKLATEYRHNKEISSRLRSIIKNYAKTRPLTLKELGITSNMIKDDEQAETPAL